MKIIDIRRVVIPPSSEIVQNIEGMDGAVYQGNNIGQRPFEIDVKLVSNTHESRLADLHDISDWLWSDKDNEYSLIFDDEPDLEWFAHVSNISEVNRTKRTASLPSRLIVLMFWVIWKRNGASSC